MLTTSPGSASATIYGTDVERVSTDSAGIQASNESHRAAISADGRYVAFESTAANLVYNDSNGDPDIFYKDLQTGVTTRISTDSAGAEANGASVIPSISANGRYVAFVSRATNLVPGDVNNKDDIFVKDTLTGATNLVSADASGNVGNDISFMPSISADGRHVAFASRASNLVPGAAGVSNVFVKNLDTGAVTLASSDVYGNQGSNDSGLNGVSISGDGRYVAFESWANNLAGGGVVVKDMQTGQVTQASSTQAGISANCGAAHPAISADGRYVAFDSCASNLVSNSVSQNSSGVFLKNLQTGQIELASTDSAGAVENHGCYFPSISADGRYVAFRSDADNLYPGDENMQSDILIKDMQTGAVALGSTDASGDQSNGGSDHPSISGDAAFVAFESTASNLVAGDTNGCSDIFRTSVNWNARPLPIDYSFPWYDNVYGLTWLLMAQPQDGRANVFNNSLKTGTLENGIPVSPGSTVYRRYDGQLGGPVTMKAGDGAGLVSERTLFGNSFEEVWGTSFSDLDNDYWWPIYDGHSMQDWVLVSNPPQNGQSVTVEVRLHIPPNPRGVPDQVQQFTLAPGETVTPQFPGWAGFPLEVKTLGPSKIIASQRVLYNGAFNEMPGIPSSKLDSAYIWTWYDNNSPGAANWICIGNPNSYPVPVKVIIAGNLVFDSYDEPDGNIPAYDNIVLRAPAGDPNGIGGPVIVLSCNDSACQTPGPPIYASQRVLWGPSFSEIAGTADFRSNANWTWYDQQTPGSTNWVLISNPSSNQIYAELSVSGTVRWSGYVSAWGNVTPTLPGVMGGPVEVKAWTDSGKSQPANVFASQRVLWNGYFNELVGKPL